MVHYIETNWLTGVNPNDLTRRDARKKFNEFKKIKDERIQELKKLTQGQLFTDLKGFFNDGYWQVKNIPRKEVSLDFSDESLLALGNWLETNTIEFSESIQNREHIFKNTHSLESLTPFWISVAVDIGTYIGECILNRGSQLSWGLGSDYKYYFGRGYPEILGFEKETRTISKSYTMNPIRVTLNKVFSLIYDGDFHKEDIYFYFKEEAMKINYDINQNGDKND